MRITTRHVEKWTHILTVVSLVFTVCMGAAQVLAKIRPFWVDEWFIIYNLKTKDAASLFGQLDLMQQFPRVYLVLFKTFLSYFDYSYFSLRLPSFILGVLIILLSIKMMKKIYDQAVFARYLFVLMLVSSFTFTEYFVQSKQYTMDILLSIFALWQLAELVKVQPGVRVNTGRYSALCLSFIVVPFFSYTYPIVIAPAYFIALLEIIAHIRANLPSAAKMRGVPQLAFPLVLCTMSIVFFYFLDVRQLMADNGMHGFWSFLMFDPGHKLQSFATCFYKLFSQLGAGLVFENIIGILGVAAFLYGMASSVRDYNKGDRSLEVYLRIYSCLVLLLTVGLFLARKLPLGDQRLNAFSMSSIIILIISLLQTIAQKMRSEGARLVLPVVLYLGVAGNIFSTYINFFNTVEYKRQMATYNATEKAIQFAQSKKLPLFVTTGVSYPYEVGANPDGAPEQGTWMVKTFPAYKMREHAAIFRTKSIDDINACFAQLPQDVSSILIGDGVAYRQVDRNGTIQRTL